MTLTDEDLMPFGKWKGIALANVPADYLLYAYNNFKDLSQDLKDYIEDNLEVLKKEEKEDRKPILRPGRIR